MNDDLKSAGSFLVIRFIDDQQKSKNAAKFAFDSGWKRCQDFAVMRSEILGIVTLAKKAYSIPLASNRGVSMKNPKTLKCQIGVALFDENSSEYIVRGYDRYLGQNRPYRWKIDSKFNEQFDRFQLLIRHILMSMQQSSCVGDICQLVEEFSAMNVSPPPLGAPFTKLLSDELCCRQFRL